MKFIVATTIEATPQAAEAVHQAIQAVASLRQWEMRDVKVEVSRLQPAEEKVQMDDLRADIRALLGVTVGDDNTDEDKDSIADDVVDIVREWLKKQGK